MSIQKIDNDETFNTLVSGLKTEQELNDAASKIVKNYYKTWKTKLKIDNDGMLDWVQYHIPELIKNCENHAQYSTIRIKLEALANLLILINKDKYKQLIKDLFLKGIALQKNIDEVKGDQDYTENEEQSKISYQELVALRRKYKNKKDSKSQTIYLILCLNTYMPPLRLEYLKTDTEAINFGCNTINYIEDTNKLIINKDKVSSKIGPVELPFEDHISKNGKQFIYGAKMAKILNKVYWSKPHCYVIPSFYDINMPMSVSSYYRTLNNVCGKPVNQNSLRKAYINYYYNQEFQLTQNDKKIIAKYMRNSVAMAESIYKKID
jgi:hypothetical protein